MAKQFLYTVTTGRSGTSFLTELLRANAGNARVLHERLGFPHFGIDTPDASHLTTFNSIGLTTGIDEFWRRKLQRDAQTPADFHIETSHVLAKAGLVESLHHLPPDAAIHLVVLTRTPFDIFWSYVNRFDFSNFGFTWLFTLDPRYPNTIIDGTPFREQGMMGNALWYVQEMFARMAYYGELAAQYHNVTLHKAALETIVQPEGAHRLLGQLLSPGESGAVVMPGRRNARESDFFGDNQRRQALALFGRFDRDAQALGLEFYRSGKRLARPSVPGH